MTTPWDPVEATWFTLLLTVDPAAVAARIRGAIPLQLPEFPGGVRIEPPGDASQVGVRQYAADFAAVLASLREGG